MAECLVNAGLPEAALSILEQCLGMGLEPGADFFALWIELQLDVKQRDPWELIAELRQLGAPDELVVVPTSEHTPLPWRYTVVEPPANIWSSVDFDVSEWTEGPGAMGSGHTPGGAARALWNSDNLFAQRHFTLRSASLLYPHFSICANDATTVYVNGLTVARMSVSTNGYQPLAARSSAVASNKSLFGGAADGGVASPLGSTKFVAGENVLGMNAINTRGPSCSDVGIVQPLGDLFWILEQFEKHGALRMNCGGESYEAPDGTAWAADRFYSWGQPDRADPDEAPPAVAGTDNPELYRSNRWFYDNSRSSWYQIPVPNGAYMLRLHFAEIDPEFAEPGSRKFDIDVESAPLERGFDLVAEIGFATAFVIEAEVEVRDGWFDVFPHHPHNRAFVCGLEIVRQ